MNSKSKLDSYMKTESRNGKHQGLSFGVYSEGDTQFWNYGASDHGPIVETNFFEMGSIGKVFTAILILKLEHQSLLSIDDFVEKYVHEFPIKNKITIRHLLTHTSGLPASPSNWQFIAPQNSFIGYTQKMLIKDLETVEITESTFNKFFYSDYGYILLGFISKRVTSETSFSSLLTREVLHPLNLKNIVFKLSESEIHNNLINGHGPDSLPVSPYLDLGEIYASVGAMKTTTKELLNFAQLLLCNDKPSNEFKSVFKKLLETSEDKDGKPISIGLRVRKNDNGIAYYHPGSIAGTKCNMVFNLEKQIAQVYISNTLYHVKILWELFYS